MALRFYSIAAALMLFLLSAAMPLRAEKVDLAFVNTDLDKVVSAISQLTGRNFLLDPKASGKINLISSSAVEKASVYGIFLSALRLQGYAVIDSGNGPLRIVPEASAQRQGVAVVSGAAARQQPDRLITQVVPLKYESAAQVVNAIRPMISANQHVAAYSPSNAIIISDYADNIARVMAVIQELDKPELGEYLFIPLKHISAQDASTTLTRLLNIQATAEPGKRLSVVPDHRTNSIVVRADSKEPLLKVQSLMNKLDMPMPTSGNAHVIYLKHADAEKLAAIIKNVLADPTFSGTVTAAATPVAAGQTAAASAASSSVQADKANNALVFTATEAQLRFVKALVDKLDVRRAQVYVEAMIAEVSTEKVAQFGIQWQTADGLGGSKGSLGGTNFGGRGAGNILDAALNPLNVASGLNFGVTNGQVTTNGTTITNLGVLARALETEAKANILSTPNILTMDNEEAVIVVGENVPFVTGQYTQTSGGVSQPFQTIERKDVGLTLKVTPQISSSGIRMKVYQEASSVSAAAASSAGPTTNKRSITSQVMVEDGQIIVIGGLIKDDVRDVVEKVPFLGDIPLLGSLFRYNSRQQVKTNLMVFLRPVVLRNDAKTAEITLDRYAKLNAMREEAKPDSYLTIKDMALPGIPKNFELKTNPTTKVLELQTQLQ